MQRLKIYIFLLLVLTPLVGCHSFTDLPDADKQLPSYWANRDYVDPSVAGPLNTSIDWFAGRVTYKGGDGKFHFLAAPVFAGTPTIKTNTVESSFSFQTAFDHSFSQSATFPGISAAPATDYSETYEITDIANVIVPDANTPTRTEVTNALTTDGISLASTTPIWWVAAVGLSTVRTTSGKKLGVTDSVTGTGFSINGTVMNSDTAASYTPLTSILTLPMNAAADAVVAATPPPVPPPPTPAAPAAAAPMVAFAFHFPSAGTQNLLSWSSHLTSNSDVLIEGVVDK